MSSITSFTGEYAFLSNFYITEVEYNGYTFHSSEAAFQAAKADDELTLFRFSKIVNPVLAKRAGRKLNIDVDDWNYIRVQKMREILVSKFSNQELMDKLKATGDAILIEGNNHGDRFWGKCGGVGQNILGKLLMEIRG